MGIKTEIKLNELLNIPQSEYSDWTFCLNNEQYHIYTLDGQDGKRLMQHISWRRGAGMRMFRKIETKYCLQFVCLDVGKKRDRWLFLGAFDVDGFNTHDNGDETWNLKMSEKFKEFAERLIVRFQKIPGPKQAKIGMANIETIEVVAVLDKRYVDMSQNFPGYDNVSLMFDELKRIIDTSVDNWRVLLENVNCVYAITDTKTGKIYIGSTYGQDGVWQRWSAYVETKGHGGDVELKKLIDEDPDYAENFKFTILQVFLNNNSNDHYILKRENYWKEVFLTREEGLNRN